MKAIEKFIKKYESDLFYTINVITYVSAYCGTGFRPLVKENGEYKVFNNSFAYTPFRLKDIAKFRTYEEAENKARELVKTGVLPNVAIGSLLRSKYGTYNDQISIEKRDIGDIIGDSFASYLCWQEDGCKMPVVMRGDIIYSFADGISKLVQDKVLDVEFNNGVFKYKTDYYLYPVEEKHFLTQKQLDQKRVIRRDSLGRPVAVESVGTKYPQYSQIRY